MKFGFVFQKEVHHFMAF